MREWGNERMEGAENWRMRKRENGEMRKYPGFKKQNTVHERDKYRQTTLR